MQKICLVFFAKMCNSFDEVIIRCSTVAPFVGSYKIEVRRGKKKLNSLNGLGMVLNPFVSCLDISHIIIKTVTKIL